MVFPAMHLSLDDLSHQGKRQFIFQSPGHFFALEKMLHRGAILFYLVSAHALDFDYLRSIVAQVELYYTPRMIDYIHQFSAFHNVSSCSVLNFLKWHLHQGRGKIGQAAGRDKAIFALSFKI